MNVVISVQKSTDKKTGFWRQIIAELPQLVNRFRLGMQSGIGRAFQVIYHSANAPLVMLNPRAQPTADISTARDGGEIVELFEQTAAREALQNSESKRGAANPAAGETECGTFFWQRVNGHPECL